MERRFRDTTNKNLANARRVLDELVAAYHWILDWKFTGGIRTFK